MVWLGPVIRDGYAMQRLHGCILTRTIKICDLTGLVHWADINRHSGVEHDY
jgi:hypothetical protein